VSRPRPCRRSARGPAPAPVPAAVAAEASGTASREMPATAERAFALQRALARQHDNTHRDAAAPGLVTQVATTGGAASGGGAEAQGDDPSHGRKPGRAWSGGGVPGVTLPATAAPAVPTAAVGHLTQAPGDAATPGPAANAAWRAAFASSALPDLAGAAADAARSAAAPGLVAGLPPAVELAAIRDRGPVVVETPRAPELDAATGEAVHTQIVKSIRMQWTGGLGEARVTLKPDYLGEVTASIKVEQGVVTATLQADTPEVRRWMESHTATLRDALVDHGLRLDRLTVGEPERQAAPGDRQAKSRQQPRQQAPRQRARRETSGTDTPFEVTPD
jgi:Flagellar hook-length control protein FliK